MPSPIPTHRHRLGDTPTTTQPAPENGSDGRRTGGRAAHSAGGLATRPPQHVHRPVEVEPLAAPRRRRRVGADLDVRRGEGVVRGLERGPRPGRRRRRLRPGAAVRPQEPNASGGVDGDAEPSLVHRPVVPAAKQHQVVERGPAAVRPVLDVVRVASRRLPQPGNRHWRSRAASARRRAGEMFRVRRPTSRISPPGPWRMVTAAASQARRRAVSAETWMPPASSSTVWRAAAGDARGTGADVAGRRARDRALDAAVVGRAPGQGPDVRRRLAPGVPAGTSRRSASASASTCSTT